MDKFEITLEPLPVQPIEKFSRDRIRNSIEKELNSYTVKRNSMIITRILSIDLSITVAFCTYTNKDNTSIGIALVNNLGDTYLPDDLAVLSIIDALFDRYVSKLDEIAMEYVTETLKQIDIEKNIKLHWNSVLSKIEKLNHQKT